MKTIKDTKNLLNKNMIIFKRKKILTFMDIMIPILSVLGLTFVNYLNHG